MRVSEALKSKYDGETTDKNGKDLNIKFQFELIKMLGRLCRQIRRTETFNLISQGLLGDTEYM